MAAKSEIPLTRVVDLRHLRAVDLDALLAEEVATWQRRLRWDFRPSAELVRRFVDMQALSGYALMHADEAIGYTYYVCEERKGLIGDLYVTDAYRSPENENALLSPVLDVLFNVPFVRRVESQLMMLGQPIARPLPMASRLQTFARNFMESDLAQLMELPSTERSSIRLESWSDSHQEEAARVIAAAYAGHIDSRINDQYRSAAGARRFLLNIIQYPGCGNFFRAGSFVAMDAITRRMCGICLSSMVDERVGHITQICVTPEVRGTGTGFALMRRALHALAAQGCTSVSLTVTSANENAIALYERMGFRTTRNFAAYVWEAS